MQQDVTDNPHIEGGNIPYTLSDTLQKGEAAFKERLEEIRSLKIKIASARREIQIASSNVISTDSFQRDVFRLQKELSESKFLCS